MITPGKELAHGRRYIDNARQGRFSTKNIDAYFSTHYDGETGVFTGHFIHGEGVPPEVRCDIADAHADLGASEQDLNIKKEAQKQMRK